MDQLFCMRVFARVVEQGSFARAAEDLEIAPPTATGALAQLESTSACDFFTARRGAFHSPTKAARSTRAACACSTISPRPRRRSRRARIATRTAARSTPHSFIYQDFLPALPRFLERYPQLDVELVLTDRAVNLVEEGIDCAVRAVQVPDDSTLVARRIAEWKWLACASREYLERHGRPQNPEELEHHNCIRFVSPSHGRTAAWQFKKGATDVSFTPRGNLGVTSAEGAAAAAAVGIGIAQVSHVLALPGLRSGALEPLLVDWAIAGAPLQVVYPSNRYLGAKGKSVHRFRR